MNTQPGPTPTTTPPASLLWRVLPFATCALAAIGNLAAAVADRGPNPTLTGIAGTLLAVAAIAFGVNLYRTAARP